jgi:hypothetical protein
VSNFDEIQELYFDSYSKGGSDFTTKDKCMVRCLNNCDIVQFSEIMCIRRSIAKKLLQLFMPFDL